MVRDFDLVLTLDSHDYNLWNDLILPLLSDPTFGDTAFVPSMVCEISYQNTAAGSTVTVNGGFQLLGGSWDVKRSSKNTIDLKSFKFNTDTPGSTIHVSLVAN